MSKKIQLKIATPERVILEESVDQVSVPTADGEITVLPNHVPLVAALSAGDIVAMQDGEALPMAVVGGFLQVKPDEVVVLADFAEHVAEISEEEIQKAKERAEKAMEQKEKLSAEEFEYFATQLERSLTRQRALGKWKGKKYKKVNI